MYADDMDENVCSFCGPCGHIMNMSPTYHSQHLGLLWYLFSARVSNSTMLRSASAGDKGLPIGAPFSYLYVWFWDKK